MQGHGRSEGKLEIGGQEAVDIIWDSGTSGTGAARYRWHIEELVGWLQKQGWHVGGAVVIRLGVSLLFLVRVG